MEIEIVSENKICGNPGEAVNELAFCHYPVTVRIALEQREFSSFDDAREFVLSAANDCAGCTC